MRTGKKTAKRKLEPADREVLVDGLSKTLQHAGFSASSFEIDSTGAHLRQGTHPSETVICRLANGSKLQLFCKYSKNYSAQSHRHRAGVAYEAEVYRRLVQPFPGSSAEFFGTFESEDRGLSFLFLEELQNVLRVGNSPPENMARAADWIGRFHAVNESNGSGAHPDFLTVYDLDYYRQWPKRAYRLTGPMHGEYPWLRIVCEVFEHEIARTLVEAPSTIIHGEFYPKNVLAKRDAIYPVDWESAAVAAGEIDLASLTEGWSKEALEQCTNAYCRARWPDGAPARFDKTVEAARFYWVFRWLGNGPYFATSKRGVRLLDALRALAEKTGIL
jgi:hypothetical protein